MKRRWIGDGILNYIWLHFTSKLYGVNELYLGNFVERFVTSNFIETFVLRKTRILIHIYVCGMEITVITHMK